MFSQYSNQGYALLDSVMGGANLGQRRNIARIAAVTGGLVVLATLTFVLFSAGTVEPRLAAQTIVEEAATSPHFSPVWRTAMSLCNGYDPDMQPQLDASEAKYLALSDNQFTIVIQSYKRADMLQKTISEIVKDEPKSLHSIIIAWNDLDTKVPKNWKTKGGIQIRYRQSKVNSLNQKFLPDDHIKTKAVLVADDDCYWKSHDLELAFQAWRESGRSRMVGGWPRIAHKQEDGKMKYTIPRGEGAETYNMVLTGLSFTHVAMLDFYSSEHPISTKLRTYVDEHFNCEDIALNYLSQSVTGCSPLFVKGHDGVQQTPRPAGKPSIGTKPGHLDARSRCLEDFNELFGRNPLQDQTGWMLTADLRAF